MIETDRQTETEREKQKEMEMETVRHAEKANQPSSREVPVTDLQDAVG